MSLEVQFLKEPSLSLYQTPKEIIKYFLVAGIGIALIATISLYSASISTSTALNNYNFSNSVDDLELAILICEMTISFLSFMLFSMASYGSCDDN